MSNKGGRVSPDYLADIAPEYALDESPNRIMRHGISVPSLGKGAQWVSPCPFGKPLSTSIYLYLAVLIVDVLRGVKNVTAEHMD